MRKGSWRLALLFVALLAAMTVKYLLEQPPSLRPYNAADQFDASRAKTRLATILSDQRPHPVDSPGDDLLRSNLVSELQLMGLKPVVRDQFACNDLVKQRGVSCARVRNVIAVLGPHSGKALLLNAHYDSVTAGPGASDDGMGVATLLELASILKDRPLKRPLILLFNEGEELGLIGARAFLADPLSRSVDSLINLEARGVRGPVIMFETSRPNATSIRLFAAAVKNPVANSLATDIYRLMPNSTDVNSFSERGWLTLNLAPIGNETRYHSSGDDLAAQDLSSLQHMGDQTLALTKMLADGTPQIEDGNQIFLDVAGRELVSIPQPLGVLLLIGLFLAFLFVSIRSDGLPREMAVVVGTFIGSAFVTMIALALVGAMRAGMFWRAEPIWTHLASYASAILVGAALLASLAKSADLRRLRLAFWLFLLGLGGLIGLYAPGAIVFFIFPPLIAGTGMVIARWWRPAEPVASAAAILFLYLSWGGLLGLLEELLDNGPMWLFAPLGSLVILPCLIEARPLIASLGMRSSTVIGAVLALLCWTAVLASPGYSADRKQLFVIEHIEDFAHGKSWWSVLNDGARLPNGFGHRWSRGKLSFSDQQRWLAPAPLDPGSQPPGVQVLSQIEAGNERSLTLRLSSNGNDNIGLIAAREEPIRSAGVAGFVRPIDQTEPGKSLVRCFGRSCDGAIVELTIGKLTPVHFVLFGSKAPLPPSSAALIAARPSFARAQYKRDESIAFTIRRL